MSDEASAFALGIDIGGTKIAAGIVDCRNGSVLLRREMATDRSQGTTVTLAATVELAQTLLCIANAEGWLIRGIGLGVPEVVDPEGRIGSAHVIGWTDRAVREAFRGVAPITIEADVRAAARAEAWFGAGRNAKTFAYITIGTGISSCLVIDGEPFPGERGGALVLASGTQTVRCAACGKVTTFVLEEFASGPALARRLQEATGRLTVRAEDVLAAAQRGDAAAVEIVTSAARALGNAAGQLCNVLDPALLVIGGGLGSVDGPFWDVFVQSTRDHIWSPDTRSLPIVHAGFGADSGMIGAALATWRRLSSSQRGA